MKLSMYPSEGSHFKISTLHRIGHCHVLTLKFFSRHLYTYLQIIPEIPQNVYNIK
jgi:hypothetical protein